MYEHSYRIFASTAARIGKSLNQIFGQDKKSVNVSFANNSSFTDCLNIIIIKNLHIHMTDDRNL